jgi:hypothetical protein
MKKTNKMKQLADQLTHPFNPPAAKFRRRIA